MGILVCGGTDDLAQLWVRALVDKILRNHEDESVHLVTQATTGARATRHDFELLYAKLVEDSAKRLWVHGALTPDDAQTAVLGAADDETICVAVGDEGLAPLLALPHVPRRRIVVVLLASTYRANVQALDTLRLSCFDFAVLMPARVVNGAETSGLLVQACEPCWPPQTWPSQRCVTHGDLARAVAACCGYTKPVHRLCSVPRVHMQIFSYKVSPDAPQLARYAPKMTRMHESYDAVLLKAPFSRWGGLKASENRTSAASFARRDQLQPLDALVCPEGNLMPRELKHVNHIENLLGAIQ